MLLGYWWYLLEMTSNKMIITGVKFLLKMMITGVKYLLSAFRNSGSKMLLQADGEELVEAREDIQEQVRNCRPTC
jgi:hypothetical protein